MTTKIHTISNHSPSNKTIIFLHGNSSSSKIFQATIKSDLPYKLYSFDLPGHGQSASSHDIDQYSLNNFKRVAIQQINQHKGDVLLVGNSLGGHIAIEIAQQLRQLKGLLIMGTAPLKTPLNFEEAITPNQALSVFLTGSPDDDAITNAINATVYNEKHRELASCEFKKSDPNVRAATSEDLTNGRWGNQYEIFKQLTCPKMIIQGRQEPSVSFQYLSNVADVAKADLRYIEECGHYPSLDQPEAFINLLKIFAHKCFE